MHAILFIRGKTGNSAFISLMYLKFYKNVLITYITCVTPVHNHKYCL